MAFGTLFSSVEHLVSQIVNALFLVPILAYPVGGIPSTFSLNECGTLFPVDSSQNQLLIGLPLELKITIVTLQIDPIF